MISARISTFDAHNFIWSNFLKSERERDSNIASRAGITSFKSVTIRISLLNLFIVKLINTKVHVFFISDWCNCFFWLNVNYLEMWNEGAKRVCAMMLLTGKINFCALRANVPLNENSFSAIPWNQSWMGYKWNFWEILPFSCSNKSKRQVKLMTGWKLQSIISDFYNTWKQNDISLLDIVKASINAYKTLRMCMGTQGRCGLERNLLRICRLFYSIFIMPESSELIGNFFEKKGLLSELYRRDFDAESFVIISWGELIEDY